MMGFININKPQGKTSHDVVAILRRITRIKQIGHTGTLDPLATGVLPIAIGKASRLIEFLQENKAYIADLQFGKISDTYDIEGNIEKYSDIKVSKEQVEKALKQFGGEIEQIPPAHSAVHYKGKRLYELARQGIIPDDIPKRKVTINKINLLNFDEEKQIAKIEIDCSKGTYIRSIINDLGMMLDCGALMSGLIRTQSGLFTIDNSLPINDKLTKESIENNIINPLCVLPFQQKKVNIKEMEMISHGQAIKTNEFLDKELVCLKNNNQLCAIAQKEDTTNKLIVKKVFI